MRTLPISSTNKQSFTALYAFTETEGINSSRYIHHVDDVRYYYPFKNETPEQLDNFLKSQASSWSHTTMGERYSATTTAKLLPKLNITEEQFASYKNRFKAGLPLDETGILVEKELKSKGLIEYLNRKPPKYLKGIINYFKYVARIFK